MYQEEIAKGIELFDKKKPNWADGLDLSHFDMRGSPHGDDILDLVYGGYPQGLVALGISDLEALSYGFTLQTSAQGLSLDEARRAYEDLTRGWLRAISAI